MALSADVRRVVTTIDSKPFAGGKPGPVFRKMHALFQASKRKA